MDRKRVRVIPAMSFGMVDIALKKIHLQTILSSLCSPVLGFISLVKLGTATAKA
jgi:hypothetical protein